MTATLSRTALPAELREHETALETALNVSVRDTWDEGTKFTEATQPFEIGRVLIRALHPKLAGYSIGYIFKEKLVARGEPRAAFASKVTGKLAHYSDLDFLIEVNWSAYRLMTGPQRVALVDHELCHFSIAESEKGDTLKTILPHDVEEFHCIVSRWGLWTPELKMFANHVRNAPQFDLFAVGATAADEEGRD
jgi:hypothetical protein